MVLPRKEMEDNVDEQKYGNSKKRTVVSRKERKIKVTLRIQKLLLIIIANSSKFLHPNRRR